MTSPTPTHSPIAFRDCVQRFPTLEPHQLRLVAFDWEGHRRFETISHRTDADAAHAMLMALTRQQYPAPDGPRRLTLS